MILATKILNWNLSKKNFKSKKDELEDIADDLDIKEASFSNEFKEVEEKHQEEVEELITKKSI